MAKAEGFAAAAAVIHALADESQNSTDAYVTLCVHAGIAAADVVCARQLGEYARGENHEDALTLLGRADKAAVNHLRTLLRMKSEAGYSHTPITGTQALRAKRAMTALLEAARAAR